MLPIDLLRGMGSFVAVASLYLGPETTLPLLSLLAGVVGIFLMFGRYIIAVGRRTMRFLIQRVGEIVRRGQPS